MLFWAKYVIIKIIKGGIDLKKWLLCLCLLMVTLCACTKEDKIQNIDYTLGITPLTYQELQEKMADNHYFILYIGRGDCRDCIEFYPLLENYLQSQQDLGVYYLDIREFRDNSRKEGASQEEKDFFANLTETLEIDWVPTLQQRQGEVILSSITYLDMAYYDIEEESEQLAAKEKYVKAIFEWLEDVGRKTA